MLGQVASVDRLTLYGSFTSSSSYKPMLYLALARLPFSFRTVNLKTGVQNSPDYLAINRWGVVPSLRHRGLTILQSNVILDYLARDDRAFRGRDRAATLAGARVAVLGGRSHHRGRAGAALGRFRPVDPEVMAYFRPRAEAALSFIDKALRDREWLVGEHCTIADIGCWGRMVFMAEGGIDIANWPHLEAWSRRLRAMPGFALPYDLIPRRTANSTRNRGDAGAKPNFED